MSPRNTEKVTIEVFFFAVLTTRQRIPATLSLMSTNQRHSNDTDRAIAAKLAKLASLTAERHASNAGERVAGDPSHSFVTIEQESHNV